MCPTNERDFVLRLGHVVDHDLSLQIHFPFAKSFKNFVAVNVMMSRSPDSEDKVSEGHSSRSGSSFPHASTADFQCFVCGTIFTSDEDRKRHLENEAHGKLHYHTTKEEMRTAREQEEYDESQRN
jgi:hypothetical protein